MGALEYHHINEKMELILCLRDSALNQKAREILSAREGYYAETPNLQFKSVRIQFYPEDIEKMKQMSLEDRVNYKRMLKENNRYIGLDNPYDIATQ